MSSPVTAVTSSARAKVPHYINPNKNVYLGEEPPVHNASTYTNWGCRCEECKASWRAHVRDQRFRRRDRLMEDPTLATHGTTSTYENWMCRCEKCTQAHRDRNWLTRQRRALRERKGQS